MTGFVFLSTAQGGLYTCHLMLKIIRTCRYYYLHCTEGETIAEKSNNIPKFTQLAKARD